MKLLLVLPLKSKVTLGVAASLIALAPIAASARPAIKALRGANQQTTYTAAFPAPLVVWVSDPVSHRAIPGIRVNFTAGSGIALNASYAVTDQHGLASVTATGLVPCSSSVSAEISGGRGAKVSFDGLVVDKATLTVVPADMQSNGGPVPALTSYTIVGFVNGETLEMAHVTGAPVLTTTATANSQHANYAIKGGVGTLWAPNYKFVAGFGTLAVYGGANSGSQPDALQEALVVPPADGDVIAVRPALATQRSLVGASRKFSAVPAQTAIAKSISAASVSTPTHHTLQTQATAIASAQPAHVTVASAISGAPVQAIVERAAATPQSSYARGTIRKALNPPVYK